MSFRDHPILLTCPICSLDDLYRCVSAINPGEHVTPRNLDGFADLLRDTQADRIVAADWRVPAGDTERVQRVLADANVTLIR